MTPLVYNLSMLTGLGLCTAGVALVAGIGPALLAAGGGLIALTIYSATLATRGGQA